MRIVIGIMVVAFVLSGVVGFALNRVGSSGTKVAEAAGRVERQVSDAREVFTDIREMIPEGRLEASPLGAGYAENTSGGIDVPSALPSIVSGSDPGLATPQAPLGSAGDHTDGDVVREAHSDPSLTYYQEAMERIVDEWSARYHAAKHEHEELVSRIEDTHNLWPEYLDDQAALVETQGDARLRQIMRESLDGDIAVYNRWKQRAHEVEMRSADAIAKIESMNTFIAFYKNQSDFKAMMRYDDLEVPLRVGLLLDSLSAFEAETVGLANAVGEG